MLGNYTLGSLIECTETVSVCLTPSPPPLDYPSRSVYVGVVLS